jgi:hypothetical protein
MFCFWHKREAIDSTGDGVSSDLHLPKFNIELIVGVAENKISRVFAARSEEVLSSKL